MSLVGHGRGCSPQQLYARSLPKNSRMLGVSSAKAQFHVTCYAASPYLLDFKVGQSFGERQGFKMVLKELLTQLGHESVTKNI